MPSSVSYLTYILDSLSLHGDVSCRPMMGEYILYCEGKPVGGIYDDRLLVMPTPSALRLLPNAPRELPYPGAKEMLLVEETDDRAFLAVLFSTIAAELPAPKKRK